MTINDGKCTERTRKLPNLFTPSTSDKFCDEIEKEFSGHGVEDENVLLGFEFIRKHWTVENGISKCEW